MANKITVTTRKSLSDLTKEEFEEVLLTFMVGNLVRTAVAEAQGKNWHKIDKQLDLFLDLASERGFTDLIDDSYDRKIPANKICLKEDQIIDAFIEDEFWEELEVRLGQRDFYQSLTSDQKKNLEKDFWLPETITKFYEKFQNEFEKFGIERIDIDSSTKTDEDK